MKDVDKDIERASSGSEEELRLLTHPQAQSHVFSGSYQKGMKVRTNIKSFQ